MTCHAYMLTGVGLDLMHLLGWVSMHDTHHHMGFLRKKFCSWYFWCMDFWVVTVFTYTVLHVVTSSSDRGGRGRFVCPISLCKSTLPHTAIRPNLAYYLTLYWTCFEHCANL